MNAPVAIVLELFVQGQSPHSVAACDLLRRVCETHLKGRYQLEVIDIQQQTLRARDAQVIAAPALVRRKPEPVIRVVGRLTEERILSALGVGCSGEPRPPSDPDS